MYKSKTRIAEILEEKKLNIKKGVDENGEIVENKAVYEEDSVQELIQEIQEKKKTDKENRNKFRRSKTGGFYCLYYDVGSLLNSDLTEVELFCLLRLASFMKYNGLATIRKNQFASKMLYSKSVAYRILKELEKKQYVFIKDDIIHIKRGIAVKGRAMRKPDSNVTRRFRKISQEGIQDLYVNNEKHKTIGRVLRMIPFLNNENVLVESPIFWQTSTKEVPLTEESFYLKSHPEVNKIYSTNLKNFMDDVYQIKFKTKDMNKPQYLLRKSYMEDYKQEVLIVNPRLIGILEHQNENEINTTFYIPNVA